MLNDAHYYRYESSVNEPPLGQSARLTYAFNNLLRNYSQWNADGQDTIPGACDMVAESFKPN